MAENELLPSFETERLLLRSRTMADFDSCLAMDRDRDVTKYIPGPWNDPPKHETFLKDRIENSFGKNLGYWSIFPKQQPNQFAGWILLLPYDDVGPEIEIGWRLNRFAWGKGFATEAARSIVEHAFCTVGVNQIIADIDPFNISSIHVAEKLGMNFIGDGGHGGDPCKCYALTKDNFIDTTSKKIV